MSGPLQGIRVLDLSSMISGPLATMLLGDQGAEVIKVEAPGIGDLVRGIGMPAGFSPTFLTANRNKRSIVLDLKRPGGRGVVERLIERADVFVQNLRPGVIERMGLGEDVVRRIRPNIVYVSISGFGETGPYAHKRVYDPVIQALSGLASIQGDRETGRPRMVRTIVPDKLTAMTAAQAITAALLARERSGQGQHVRLAMLDAMVSFLWAEGMAGHTYVDAGPRKPRPPQKRDLVFQASDGYMTAGTVSDGEWAGFCRAAGHPEWIDDERFATTAARIRNWDARLELMQSVIETASVDEWLERLDAEQVPCGPILSRRGVIEHPQIAANELIVEGEHPHVGRIRQTRPAARFSETPAEIRRPAPALGEHTDELLSEAGYAADEIAALRQEGALG